jgi:hypothetical protein
MRNVRRHPCLIQLIFAVLLNPGWVLAQVDVLTQRYDNARSGGNLKETKLKTSNVNKTSFGKLAFRIVDGNIYAQPLIVSGARIASHPGVNGTNVAIIATEHNSVYAFDTDDTSPDPSGPEPTKALWHTGPAVLGTHVESLDLGNQIKAPGCVDLTTEIGITSTPVIQITNQTVPKEGIVFVVAKSKTTAGKIIQKLFSLSLGDGTVLGQITIAGDVKGIGSARITFDPLLQFNRPALLLDNNMLYIAFGGHCDQLSYHGWIFAYDVTNPKAPKKVDVFSDTLTERAANDGNEEGRAGIWMSGQGPATDGSGNVYFATGDGTFNGTTDFGNSVLKIKLVAGKIQIQDWFTPATHEMLKQFDADLGSGGAVTVPNSHLMLAGGKEGRMYLIDRNAMGHGANALHDFQVTNAPINRVTPPVKAEDRFFWNIHGSPVIWPRQDHMFVYIDGEEDPLKQYKLIPDTGGAGWKFDSDNPLFKSVESPGLPPANLRGAGRTEVFMPGGFITLSADGDQDGTGIVWVTMPFADNANHKVVRGVLRAFDAIDVSRGGAGQLWSSEDENIPTDSLGMFAKFCPPVVANGKVYVATFQQETVGRENNVHQKMVGGAQSALAIYGLK